MTLIQATYKRKIFFNTFLITIIMFLGLIVAMVLKEGFIEEAFLLMFSIAGFFCYYLYHIVETSRLYLSTKGINSPIGYIPFLYSVYPQYAIRKFTLDWSKIHSATLVRSSYFKKNQNPEFIKLTIIDTQHKKYILYPAQWHLEQAADKPKAAILSKQHSQQELKEHILQSPLIRYLAQQNIPVNIEEGLFEVN